MNKRPMIRAGAALSLLLAPVAGRAETLHEAIVAAFAGNPTLGAARSRQEALAEAPEQARAGGRLTAAVDGGGGYDRFGYGKGIGGTASAALPIWTGGRVGSAVRAAEGDVAAGRAGLRESEAAIVAAVVAAYSDLLYDQESVNIAQADIALLDNQVADARSRFRLGNATRTDVARLEAQRASAGATLASAQTQLATDAAQYRAIVGRDPGELQPMAGATALPATLGEAHDRALAANPLYQQSQRLADADAARIDQARANGNPSLTVGAAYGEDANFARASNRYFPVVANAGVTLHVPILTGGLVASQVRQAKAEHRAAVSDVEAAGREAVRSADAAWAALAGSKAQASANELSVEAAELALKGVRAEYAFGLRSTLDILVADESLRGAQLALARSRSDTLVAEAALLRATGRLDDTAF
jgi:outer membrane protein